MLTTVETKHFVLCERHVYELPREVAEVFLRRQQARQVNNEEQASKVEFRT
jgi:hypothetical protein